jgi:hypothetical protein
MHLEMSRTFPVPRKEGFAYVIDPATWAEWSPIEIGKPEEVRFSKAGDLVAFTYRPVGIPIHGKATIEAITPGEFTEILFTQRAFSDVKMRWEFDNAGAHAFTMRVTVDWDDDQWWLKTMHFLSLVPAAIRRDIGRSFDRLHHHFVAAHEVKKAS